MEARHGRRLPLTYREPVAGSAGAKLEGGGTGAGQTGPLNVKGRASSPSPRGLRHTLALFDRRPPASLRPQIGSGVQIILTSTVTLLLATMGFLSPAARGALLTTTIVLYVWLAFVAGFSAVYAWGNMERSYNGWPIVCASVAVFFPGITLAIFTLLNVVIHHTGQWSLVNKKGYACLVYARAARPALVTFQCPTTPLPSRPPLLPSDPSRLTQAQAALNPKP